MSKTKSPPAGEILTDDLINEILLRLPVKSILRCQSVSKTWLSLIKNPNFAKSQLRHAIQTHEDKQTLICKNLDQNEENKTSISLLSVKSRRIGADLKFPYSRGEFEFAPDFVLVGSANGIVCVSVAVSETPPEHNWLFSPLARRKTNTYLWNPATRHSKLVPSCGIRNNIRREALGFGFDPIENDFKLVRVVAPPFSAQLYSANRNAWGKVSAPVDIPYDDAFDVCVNGFLCCTGLYGMTAFDLNKAVLNCAIKFPVSTFNAHITNFNDSIAVLLSSKAKSSYKIDMWKLDDEACLRGVGVAASWTIMFSVDLDLPVRFVPFVHGYFRSGNILLWTEDGRWFSYDSNKKEAKIVPVSISIHQNFKYTESLVSIPGFKQVNWNAREDDN